MCVSFLSGAVIIQCVAMHTAASIGGLGAWFGLGKTQQARQQRRCLAFMAERPVGLRLQE